MDTFVVVVALFVAWCALAIDKIVVERDLNGSNAVRHQLNRQAFAGRGFTARRRSGNQHHSYALALGNHIADLCDFLLLKSLADVDDVACKALLHGAVELADRSDFHDVLPAVMLLEHLKHLVLSRHFAEHRRVFRRGNAQQQTVVVRFESEQLHRTRVLHQCSVEIVHEAVQVVVNRVERAECFEQCHFRVRSDTLK